MILAAALLALKANDEPALRAVLVGTTAFAPGSGLKPPRGVAKDLERMRAVCQAYGEAAPIPVVGASATAAGIQSALDRALASAKKDDVCLLYFSGLGSTKGGAPSLVAADGTLAGDANDLPVAALAIWAQKVEAAGARPVIVLDVSWPTKGGTEKEFHPYDTLPRSRSRGKAVETPVYDGPGVFLAAGSPGGNAYDWMITDTEWCGAFTDLVGQTVVSASLRSQSLSPQAIYDGIARAAKDYGDLQYMPDFRPSLLGNGVASTPLLSRPPTLRAEGAMAAILDAEKKRASKYQVGLEMDMPGAAPPQKQLAYAQAKAAFVGALTPVAGDVSFAGGSQRPDSVVKVKIDDNGAPVFFPPKDDVKSSAGTAGFAEASLGELMPWFQRQALLTRLYRMADSQVATLPGKIVTTLPTEPTQADKLIGTVTPPASGLVLTMDRGEGLGIVHLYSPFFTAVDNGASDTRPLAVGSPKLSFRRSAVGAHEWRVLVLENPAGVELPSLPRGGVGVSVTSANGPGLIAAFDSATIPYLRSVLDALQSGKARWTGLVVPYTVKGNP